jgi:hypothetical protein
MNTVCKYIINERFKANEVTCGIGIDHGNMLATKTGIRRHGFEQPNYRNLVWLGRPANTASKLTDLANKPAETEPETMVRVAYNMPVNQLAGLFGLVAPSPFAPSALGSLGSRYAPANPFEAALGGLGMLNVPANPNRAPLLDEWQWKDETLAGFLSNVRVEYAPSRLVHNDPNFKSFFLTEETRVVRERTPPILMTARVWKGYRSEQPEAPSVKNGWFKQVAVKTPSLTEQVFGGDVIKPDLKE